MNGTDTIKPVAWRHPLGLVISDNQKQTDRPYNTTGFAEPLFSASSLDRAKLEMAIDALSESTDTFAALSWETPERKARVKAENDKAIAHLTALLGVATQEK